MSDDDKLDLIENLNILISVYISEIHERWGYVGPSPNTIHAVANAIIVRDNLLKELNA